MQQAKAAVRVHKQNLQVVQSPVYRWQALWSIVVRLALCCSSAAGGCPYLSC